MSPTSQRDYLLLLARWQLPHLLRGELDPEDLVNETIEKALAWLAAHDPEEHPRPAKLRAWLRTILKNTLAQHLRDGVGRRGERAVPISLQLAVEESALRLERFLAANDSTPSRKLMREEQLACLAEALMQLPEDQRQAVQLHHLDGHSLAEVGKQLGRSKWAVAGLLFRGLKKLRDALQDPL
jgi:RNA polymerase sigma-70 factor (ECF subfamily)